MSLYKDVDFNLKQTEFGDIKTQNDQQAIKQSIKNILLTPLGSLRYNPNFGSNIYRLLFEKINTILQIKIEQEIKFAIENWEPRVTIESININTEEVDNNYIEISINYYINVLAEEDDLTIQLEKRI